MLELLFIIKFHVPYAAQKVLETRFYLLISVLLGDETSEVRGLRDFVSLVLRVD